MNCHKNKRVTVRFSTEEHNQLRRNAKLVGLKRSTFMRNAALEIKIPAPISDREIMIHLAKIGGNLNQCTRTLNVMGTVDDDLLQAIAKAIVAVNEVRAMFLR